MDHNIININDFIKELINSTLTENDYSKILNNCKEKVQLLQEILEKRFTQSNARDEVTIEEQSDDESTAEGASLSKQDLIDMGFSEQRVEQALKLSNNDPNQALDILTQSTGGSRRNRRNDRKQKQNRKQNQRTRKRKTSLT